MAFQTVFKRYELKYMITRDQQTRILQAMEPYMIPDSFGKSTIRNIYFDTDDHILARHSVAKPDFKEKLRIRCYDQATEDSTVFVELKRKFDHVVYKRRVALPENIAMSWTQGLTQGLSRRHSEGKTSVTSGDCFDPSALTGQMSREIDYFLSYYGYLRPAAFISYDRQAYRAKAPGASCCSYGQTDTLFSSFDSDFRVTFDENILFRDYDISLESDVYGTPLLEEGKILMELKCSGGIPLWMTEILSEEHIYKTSFSKYGTAYTKYMLDPQISRMYAPLTFRSRVPDGCSDSRLIMPYSMCTCP